MEVRQGINKRDFANYDGKRVREELLIENVFGVDCINLVYSHVDRIIVKIFLGRYAVIWIGCEKSGEEK